MAGWLMEKKRPCYTVLDNFCGVRNPITANFTLPVSLMVVLTYEPWQATIISTSIVRTMRHRVVLGYTAGKQAEEGSTEVCALRLCNVSKT